MFVCFEKGRRLNHLVCLVPCSRIFGKYALIAELKPNNILCLQIVAINQWRKKEIFMKNVSGKADQTAVN